MEANKVFEKILKNRQKTDLQGKHTITVRVMSDLVAESIDDNGDPIRGPLYAMANTIRNQYASTDVMPRTLNDENGVRWTTYEFEDTPNARGLLEMRFGGHKLKDVILAYNGSIIYSGQP